MIFLNGKIKVFFARMKANAEQAAKLSNLIYFTWKILYLCLETLVLGDTRNLQF